MNILIINHYAGGEKYGMEFRPYYLSKELIKLGHNVTVIAADYSHIRKVNPQFDKDFFVEDFEDLKYVWIKTPKYNKNDYKRVLNMMTFYKKVKKKAKYFSDTYKPDVVIGSSTYPNDVKLAKLIADYNNAKICYEIHDLWPLSQIELYKLSNNNPFVKFIAKAEKYAFDNSDFVISILSRADKHMKELGYDIDNYFHVSNGIGFSIPSEELDETHKLCIDNIKKEGKKILMYVGGIAKANALDDLIDSAGYMTKNVQIVIIGDGVLKKQLIEQVKEENIKNVTILPSVKKNQVNTILSLADFLYIGAKNSPLYEYGVGMNKIFDYMRSKRPIIYAINTSDNPIEMGKCGITIQAENSEAIGDGVKELIKLDEETLNQMGQNGYDYAKNNYNYEVLAKKFEYACKTASKKKR